MNDSTARYRSDAYFADNPTFFEEDTAWKLDLLRPLLDLWVGKNTCSESCLRVLDVGGGAGLILRGVADYLRDQHKIPVSKYALDLSPLALQQVRANNPDLERALLEDAAACSLGDKSVDLTLMIDVLEHVTDAPAVLAQLSRCSHYVLLKVPLEDHLVFRLANCLSRGRARRAHAEQLGHVNLYQARELRKLLTRYLGAIEAFAYARPFEYELTRKRGQLARQRRWWNHVAKVLAQLHPSWGAAVYTDFALVLVRCVDASVIDAPA